MKDSWLQVQIWLFSPGATGTSNFRASDVGQTHRWLGAMDRCFSWGFFLVLPPNWLKIHENLRSGDFRWISIKLVLYGESISFYHLSTAFLTIWWKCRYTFMLPASLTTRWNSLFLHTLTHGKGWVGGLGMMTFLSLAHMWHATRMTFLALSHMWHAMQVMGRVGWVGWGWWRFYH